MKFRKKVAEVEAVRFTGDNFQEMMEFCGTHRDSGNEVNISTFNPINTFLLFHYDGDGDNPVKGELWERGMWAHVRTDDWVVKEIDGFSVCEQDIFEFLYEPIRVGDHVIIASECFTDMNEEVIMYKGSGYYRACNKFVSEHPDGGQSFCVKRVNHPTNVCEAYDGSTRINN